MVTYATNERGNLSIAGPFSELSVAGGQVVMGLVGSQEPGTTMRLYSQEYIEHVVSTSVAAFFLSFVPSDPRIEGVLWCFEGSVLRIWTVLDQPDRELQQAVYEAELRFLDKLPDVSSDFSILYRHGRPLEGIRPVGTYLLRR